MLTSKQKALLLECFLFKGKNELEIEAFLSSNGCVISNFSKGQMIFGEEGFSRLGIILSGKAEARFSIQTKSSLKTFKSGEIFGAAGVFCEQNPEPFSKVLALNDCRVLFINRDALTRLLLEDNERAVEYIRFLCGKVEFLNRRISNLTAAEIEGRFAGFILDRADENGLLTNINFAKISREVAISRASLYRAKNSLEKKKIIKTEDKTIKILDRDMLKGVL